MSGNQTVTTVTTVKKKKTRVVLKRSHFQSCPSIDLGRYSKGSCAVFLRVSDTMYASGFLLGAVLTKTSSESRHPTQIKLKIKRKHDSDTELIDVEISKIRFLTNIALSDFYTGSLTSTSDYETAINGFISWAEIDKEKKTNGKRSRSGIDFEGSNKKNVSAEELIRKELRNLFLIDTNVSRRDNCLKLLLRYISTDNLAQIPSDDVGKVVKKITKLAGREDLFRIIIKFLEEGVHISCKEFLLQTKDFPLLSQNTRSQSDFIPILSMFLCGLQEMKKDGISIINKGEFTFGQTNWSLRAVPIHYFLKASMDFTLQSLFKDCSVKRNLGAHLLGKTMLCFQQRLSDVFQSMYNLLRIYFSEICGGRHGGAEKFIMEKNFLRFLTSNGYLFSKAAKIQNKKKEEMMELLFGDNYNNISAYDVANYSPTMEMVALVGKLIKASKDQVAVEMVMLLLKLVDQVRSSEVVDFMKRFPMVLYEMKLSSLCSDLSGEKKGEFSQVLEFPNCTKDDVSLLKKLMERKTQIFEKVEIHVQMIQTANYDFKYTLEVKKSHLFSSVESIMRTIEETFDEIKGQTGETCSWKYDEENIQNGWKFTIFTTKDLEKDEKYGSVVEDLSDLSIYLKKED